MPHQPLGTASSLGSSVKEETNINSRAAEVFHPLHQASSLLGPKDVDEYDPMRPNDYEEFCNERQARALEEERERERRREERERERERGRERSRERDRHSHWGAEPMEEDFSHRSMPPQNLYPPPPQQFQEPPPVTPAPAAKIDLNISGEEVYLEPCNTYGIMLITNLSGLEEKGAA